MRESRGRGTYPRKWNFEFADMRVIEEHTPSPTGEQITRLVASMKGQERVLWVLIAATGLRIGELSGLQVKAFRWECFADRTDRLAWEPRVGCARRTQSTSTSVRDKAS